MSKVAIQGNASGTGTFTIAAPNSNTDRTLTLPDEAGTVLTSASTIDSSKVLPSGQTAWPSFRIGMTADQSETSTGQKLIVFNETSTDFCFLQGGMSLSGGIITVPVDGIYTFTYTLRINDIGSGYILSRIKINNDETANRETYSVQGSPSSTYEDMTATTIRKLNANDTVRVTIQSQSDTSWAISDASTFCGSLIAAE